MGYATDVSDEEWNLISDHFAESKVGAPRKHNIRHVFNALIYILRTGCQWRLLPNDFPPTKTVEYYFSKWKKVGFIEDVQSILHGDLREALGRSRTCSLGLIDSQSVKTIQKGDEIGIDGGKKVKGRKRHILVDVTGHILSACIHSAQIHDSKGGRLLLEQSLSKGNISRMILIFADEAYSGDLQKWIQRVTKLKTRIRISKKPNVKGFVPIFKRWIVERSFAWFGNNRRLSKDYEHRTSSSKTFLFLADLRLILKKLSNILSC